MSSSPFAGSSPRAGTELRCRTCRARLRPEETWCSLCHTPVATVEDTSQWAPLIPPEEPVRAPAPRMAAAENPLAAASAAAAEYVAGRSTDGEPEPRTLDRDPDAVADRLIADLAVAEAARGQESRFAVWSSRFSGRGGGVMLAAVGGVVLLAAGLIGLTVLGWLL